MPEDQAFCREEYRDDLMDVVMRKAYLGFGIVSLSSSIGIPPLVGNLHLRLLSPERWARQAVPSLPLPHF